jgi:hypothetical protein
MKNKIITTSLASIFLLQKIKGEGESKSTQISQDGQTGIAVILVPKFCLDNELTADGTFDGTPP